MDIFRKPDLIIPVGEGYEEERIPQYTKLYCWLGNVFDYKQWFCEDCEYIYPYGLCFTFDCKIHGET